VLSTSTPYLSAGGGDDRHRAPPRARVEFRESRLTRPRPARPRAGDQWIRPGSSAAGPPPSRDRQTQNEIGCESISSRGCHPVRFPQTPRQGIKIPFAPAQNSGESDRASAVRLAEDKGTFAGEGRHGSISPSPGRVRSRNNTIGKYLGPAAGCEWSRVRYRALRQTRAFLLALHAAAGPFLPDLGPVASIFCWVSRRAEAGVFATR